MPDPLERLADLVGIETSYQDAWGRLQNLSPERIEALLATFGLPAAGDQEVQAAIADVEGRSWRHPLPPVQVVRVGDPITLPLVLPAGLSSPLTWRIETEDGAMHEAEARLDDMPLLAAHGVGNAEFERRAIRIAIDLPLGYHTFRIAAGSDGPKGDTTLIVVPRKCYLPPVLAAGERTWGFAVQLYGVRSERNWGIGDFTDLARLIDGAHALGAGLIGVNPLHAAFLSTPERASPYEPASRLFLNVFCIDVEAAPDFAECRNARRTVASQAFQEQLQALRAAPLVDYAGVARRKLEILELLFGSFAEMHLGHGEAPLSERGEAFRRFQREKGPSLRTHAIFEVLAERFVDERGGGTYWPKWQEPYRDSHSPEVQDCLAHAPERVEFYEYLQWLAATQLDAVRKRSEERGLAIGLYLDLAVGVGRDGADVWADREAYVADARIGVPPDIWNPKGQDWGLPPLDPRVMRERAYAPFVAVLRANMRYAGALRIDHVLALLHLYWIPRDKPPSEGGFVRYPVDDLLGIVALESHRNRCLVIGEDLGTVPHDFKQRLQDTGILSYRLLYFEQDGTGRFLSPQEYPRLALASITTHDLPTLPGYWLGHDLDLRTQLDLFASSDQVHEARATRDRDRAALLKALHQEGLWDMIGGEMPELTEELIAAACAFLARTPAMIAMMQFEDVLGLMDQPNVPGTIDEHPNWRRKLPLDLDRLLTDPRLIALVERVTAARAR